MSKLSHHLQVSFTHSCQPRCRRIPKHISREKILAPIRSLAEPAPLPTPAGDILPPVNDTALPDVASKLDSIPPARLKELRRKGHEQKDIIKLGRRGVCEPLVAQIKNRWKTSEVRDGRVVAPLLSCSSILWCS